MDKEKFEGYGYQGVRQLPDGRWIGVMEFIYTVGLCVGLAEDGYMYRYCYGSGSAALAATAEWDGVGDPPGPWIKLKGDHVRGVVHGPGFRKVGEAS